MYCFKRQLTLFKRGQGYEGPQSHYVLAAWHSHRSITWRWLIWWWPKFKLIPTFKYNKTPNGDKSVDFAGPFGTFAFSTQKTVRPN